MTRSFALLLVLVFLTASCIITAEPTSGAAAAENTWVTKAPMPKEVIACGAKAAVANGKIYLVCGSVNYEYDPTTDNWTARTPMPTPKTGFSIAAYQNKIYLIGSSFNEVYDPITDTWQSKTPMPTSILSASANVVDGKIYVISGYTSDYQTVGLNQVYDIANDSWTTKKSIPTPVVSCASAVSGGKIFIMGGQDQYLGDNMNVNLNQIYDPATDSWSLGAPLPTTVLGASAGATTGVMAPERIYVFGGGLNGEIGGTNLTQGYNPQNDSWTYGAPMPIERVAFNVAVVNDLLYAIGGEKAITAPFFGNNDQYTPFGYGFSPRISISSPENKVYNQSSVALTFLVNEPFALISYSLDGQDNVTIEGNTTLTGLANGDHNLSVYVTDRAGKIGDSETIYFSVEVPEPFPIAPVAAASAATLIVIGVGLLVYLKKRKR